MGRLSTALAHYTSAKATGSQTATLERSCREGKGREEEDTPKNTQTMEVHIVAGRDLC